MRVDRMNWSGLPKNLSSWAACRRRWKQGGNRMNQHASPKPRSTRCMHWDREPDPDDSAFLFARIFCGDDRNVLWLGGPLGFAAGLGLPRSLRNIHSPGSNPHGSGAAPGTDEAGPRWNRSADSLGHAPVYAGLLGGGRPGHPLARPSDHCTRLASGGADRSDRLTGPGFVGLEAEPVFFV